MARQAARRALGALAAAVIALPAAASGFPELYSDRARIAIDLARPIEDCVRRRDTRHPAFHGCIDWHSSVHGTWALLAFGAARRDARPHPLAMGALSASRLARERSDLAADPAFEMPYGRAWFLRLVREFEQAAPGDLRLREFGDDVAASLVRRYAERAPDPGARDYDSDAWALVNLHEYAVHRGDAPLRDRVESLVRQAFVPVAGRCHDRVRERGFMAVCAIHAWLVSRVLPRQAFVGWVGGFMPPENVPAPLTSAASAHLNGLNFSRAWGLWHVWTVTREAAYRDHYAAHVLESYRRRESWDGDYRTVRHWVAQFGMLAIQPLFAPGAGTATN